MSESITSYVGITGFMAAQEVLEVLQTETLANTSRLFMCGVLVSWNTLQGGPARRPRRYPPVETLASIFQNHPRVLNLIHYNSAQAGLFHQLARLTDLAGLYLMVFDKRIR
jgi:hypothetical protein